MTAPSDVSATTASQGNLREFLAWVAARGRTYAETMEAWRTSCPRLSAWEDAIGDGLVKVEHHPGAPQAEGAVRLTERGTAILRQAPSAA